MVQSSRTLRHPQAFLHVSLQLQDVKFNISSGTAVLLVVTGTKLLLSICHPKSVALCCIPSHLCTCRYTLNECCLAAADVGGRLASENFDVRDNFAVALAYIE